MFRPLKYQINQNNQIPITIHLCGVKEYVQDSQINEKMQLLSWTKHQLQTVSMCMFKSQLLITNREVEIQQGQILENVQNGFLNKIAISQRKFTFIYEVNRLTFLKRMNLFGQTFVFELKEGVFQKNEEKTIQLIKNQNPHEYRLSLIYDQEKNMIVLRQKTYIYIIKMNDGKFKIVDYLNCDSYQIYGNIKNNGKYLIY
ncbi:unnamed protein product [Paramecium sonneborni]|uniref:Uncharacterized protein n=1 Tax=Paramecium sonneborni TaxID=65129 RepID=A0A8S1RLI7_9CILI|nr:unnamed protein product [Paramecium sonneborni]